MNWDTIFDSHGNVVNASHASASMVPLTDYRLIILSGEDSEAFLQGQCTCDFKRLEDNHILLGAHCNHKGRMNSSFHAMRVDSNTIALRVHASIAEYARDALAKYAVFSKVTVSVADDFYLLALLGDKAGDPLAGQLSTLGDGEFTNSQDYIVGQHSPQQIEIWCRGSWLQNFLSQKADLPLQKTSLAWRLANIRRGIGEVVIENVNQLLPQELNFQCIDGVSFNKGCYTGQEIVARLHYRGQLKKHLYIADIQSAVEPEINDLVISDQGRGKLVNITETRQFEYACLVLCDEILIQADTCALEKDPAAKIRWGRLPYAITE